MDAKRKRLLELRGKAEIGLKDMKMKRRHLRRHGGFQEAMDDAKREYDKYAAAIDQINAMLDEL